MTPRWLTIEKLVTELGGVCSSRHEAHQAAEAAALPDSDVDEAVGRATDAVTAVLRDPFEESGATVHTAWEAIARAQDCIAHLRESIQRSQALRERAQGLQDDSARLRRNPASRGRDDGRRRSRCTTDRH